MCTLSWQTDESYRLSLFFNRDELFARPDALPPEVHQTGEDTARFIAPVDPQGGGTWVAANEYGLTFCLLNDYQGKSMDHLSDKAKSRGLLVRELAGFKSMARVKEFITKERVKVFQPFNLVLFERVMPPVMWSWNGEELDFIDSPPMPIVSSGYSQPEVQKKRAEVFREEAEKNGGKLTAGQQLALHRSDRPNPQPWSIAMQLEDKGTVSITQVEVLMHRNAESLEITMRYWPGKPLEVKPEPFVVTVEAPFES